MTVASRFGVRDAYLKLRRFVDWDLSDDRSHAGTLSFLLGFVPAVTAIRAAGGSSPRDLAVAIGLGAFATAWVVFVAWRAWRGLRAMGIRGDRDFDRNLKHALPAEYQRSESATAAARRRKRAK